MRVEALSVDDGLLGIVHHPANARRAGCAVFVHGAAADCFDGLVWTVCRDLAAIGIRAAAVNLSSRSLGRYADSLRRYRGWPWTSTDEARMEVASFSERCSNQFGEPIVLIGHSWGALIAALAWPVVHPGRLVLISPMTSARTIVESLYSDLGHAVAEAERRGSNGRGADLISTGSLNPVMLSADTISDFSRHAPNGIADVLTDFGYPVHVVVGGREHPALVAAAQDLAGRVPDGHMTMIDGAGHFYVGRREELVSALAMSF